MFCFQGLSDRDDRIIFFGGKVVWWTGHDWSMSYVCFKNTAVVHPAIDLSDLRWSIPRRPSGMQLA
jgi:hypothetical protein